MIMRKQDNVTTKKQYHGSFKVVVVKQKL